MTFSLTVRLAILAGVLGLAQAAAVLGFFYVSLENELAARQRTLLDDKLGQARQLIGGLENGTSLRANAYRLVELVKGQTDLHMAVASSDSGEAQVAFSREAVESLQRLKLDTWGTNAYLEWQPAGGSSPMLSLASTVSTSDGEDFEIVLSVDRGADRGLLGQLLLTILTAAPIGLALVTVAATVIVGVGLRPLRRFRHAVSHVTAARLNVRLQPESLPRELKELADAFNAMLDRLRDSVTRLSQFSADLAHEMRTPLASLLAQTQVALSRKRTPEELADVLAHNVEELQRLARLVSDMLFLARADQASQALQLECVEVGVEAARVADFLTIGAEEKGVSIRIQGSARVLADRGLVQRALTNLLSNAVRHARNSSVIRVMMAEGPCGAQVAIENEGEDIPAEHLGRLFDRFYRMDPARHRDRGGSGLGLAIVRAIMELHGGTVEVAGPAPGRVQFTLCFSNCWPETSPSEPTDPARTHA